MTDCSAFLSFAQNFFVLGTTWSALLSNFFNLQLLLWRKSQMHRLFFSRQDLIVTMDVPVKSFSMMNSIHSMNLSNFQNLIPSNLFDLRLSVQKLPTIQPPKIIISQNGQNWVHSWYSQRESLEIEQRCGYLQLLVLNLVAVRLKLANVLQNLILLVHLLLIFDFLQRRLELDRNSFHVLSLLNDVGNAFHNIGMLKIHITNSVRNITNSIVVDSDGQNIGGRKLDLPKGFSPVWTRSCAKTSVLWMKALLQNLKWCGYFGSRSEVIWGHLRSLRIITYRQRNGLSPRWIRSWRNKFPRKLNVRPHKEHENGP